jgi:carbon storage regulator CsrA
VLVLSRKNDEDIVIQTPEGRTIIVKVVQIVGEKVRLGFTADPDVAINRREILTQKEISGGLERPVTNGPLPSP